MGKHSRYTIRAIWPAWLALIFLAALLLPAASQPGHSAAATRPDSAHFPLCAGGRRVTCVVDGDTVWLRGEKIRIEGIDAPELSNPGCRSEAALAEEARLRLAAILNTHSFVLTRHGKDRYGRTLGRFWIRNRTAGSMLVDAGLARVWTGRREPWC